jgi:acetolactate synthase-1/3 small subunit
VEDRSGVLQRVTNCVARRGFRLLSLAVGQGPEPGLLSLWLRVGTGPQPPDQVIKQLSKLIDVVSVEDRTEAAPLEWVTALVAIRRLGDPLELEAALNRPGVQIVRRGRDSVLAAVAGTPDQVEASLGQLRRLPVSDWVVGRPLALGEPGSAPPVAWDDQRVNGS